MILKLLETIFVMEEKKTNNSIPKGGGFTASCFFVYITSPLMRKGGD